MSSPTAIGTPKVRRPPTEALVSLLLVAAILNAAECAAAENAAPFGIVIGVTSCTAAATALGAKTLRETLHKDVHASAETPEKLYKGAVFVTAICDSPESPVKSLIVRAEAGPAAQNALEAYSELASKYLLVEEKRLDERTGFGWAEFSSGGTIVTWDVSLKYQMFTTTFITRATREAALEAQRHTTPR